MNLQMLKQADFVLNACGRPVPPLNQRWVDIPSHILYSRFIPDDHGQDIGGVQHKSRFPFYIRSITAQSLPRNTEGIYWRMRYANGRYFQNALTSHACAFGLGSQRQVFDPEVEWKPGEKVYIELFNQTNAGSPSNGYSVVIMIEGVYRFPLAGSGPIAHPLTDLARYRRGESQNILAPEFMFGSCPSETPQGYRDEEFTYVSPLKDLLALTGQQVNNVATQIEAESDFIVREVWPNIPAATGGGSVVVKMRREDGYTLSSNFIPINSIQGPMFRELRVKAGGTITHDAYVVDGSGAPGSTITFGLYFKGVRRFRNR